MQSSNYQSGEQAERPWGSWEVLAITERAVVKRIIVKPGGRLSLQSHEHRMEKWVIIQGIARVELDGLITDVAQNNHINIGLHVKHRLSNLQDEDLIIIEIQLGEILTEDDIVRYEDDYGRNES